VVAVTASPFDAPLSALREHVDDLATWLAVWEARSEPDAHARRCANDAVDAVDAMLQALHAIRASLVSEIRVSDDQAEVRVDALLAGRARDQELPGAIRPLDTEGRGAEDTPAQRERES
jgi:hypothetical protein